MIQKTTTIMLMGSLALAPLTGCESLPGDEKTQGAVIGGAGGAAAGAALSKDNRLLGALVGGALGAGGGYLIGMEVDKHNDKEGREEALKANDRAQKDPVTAADVAEARTADANKDGFVTLDEVVAMEEAGLTDREMITRLERTQQYFELTAQQEDYLRDRGVSERVVTAMRHMTPDETARLASDRDEENRLGNTRTDRISSDRDRDR